MAEEAHTSPTTAPLDGSGDEKGKEPTQQLVDTVQEKLEFLLSKQNLAEDSFIQQSMNAQMYIPFSTLIRHHSFRSLGEDPDTIIAAARQAALVSEKVGMDSEEQMLRPLNLKPRRNTLILHDLPDDLPEDELKALFEGSPESESFCSLKPDVNNTAFVSFKTDEAAQNVALWLRSQKFQGAEIKCAVKSEHFVRSFFPASGTPIMQAGQQPYMNPQQAMWGYPSSMWGVQGGWYDGSDASISNAGWGDTGAWMPDGSTHLQKGKDGDGKGKGKPRNRGKSGGFFPQDGQMDMHHMEAGSDMGTPLMGPATMGLDPDADGELAEPGYTHEYRKYTRQYIIEVCNKMEEIIKPASFEKCEKNEVALFRQEPNKDWAPLPTPMSTFSANFFDDRRGSDAEDKGKGKGKRKGKGEQEGSEAWGPGKGRTSRTESHDYEESDWAHGASSWWSDSGRRPSSWSDWDYSQTYGQKQWVKKDADAEQEADSKSGENASVPHKMSWADKVKAAASLGPSDQQKRWVAKSKPTDEAKEKEQGTDSAALAASEKASDPVAAAPSVGGAEARPAAAEPAGEAAAESPPGAERKMSWADKARQAANK